MTSAEPSLLLAAGSLLLGLAASLLWTFTGYLITITHEGSHALVGSLTGSTVDQVVIERDHRGATLFTAPAGFLAALSGYAGPSAFGIAGATLLVNGVTPEAVLWTSFVLLAVIFVRMNSHLGIFVTALWGAIFFLVVRHGSPDVRALAAYTWIWFLLIGGVVHTFRRNFGGNRSADSGFLRDLTKVPQALWCLLWCLATAAALVYGGGIIFHLVDPPLAR